MAIIWSFATRHLWRHRHINVIVLLVTLFSATILAALPTYATVIAVRNLQTTLEYSPTAERNLAILAARGYKPNAAIRADILKPIDDLVLTQIDLLKSRVASTGSYFLDGDIQVADITLWSMTRMGERMQLIEGNFPQHWIPRTQVELLHPPQAEALIGLDVAFRVGLTVGDVMTSTAGNVFTIVGIVEPIQPNDDIWYDDLSIFEVGYRALNINEDVANVSLLIPMQSMSDYFPFYEAETRIIIDHNKITISTIDAVESVLIDVHRVVSRSGLNLTTGLDDLIQQYRNHIKNARITLVLLTLQSTLFSMYVLMVMTNVLMEISKLDIAVMVSRGASRLQITGTYALEYFFIALPTIAVAPIVSRITLQLIVKDASQVLPKGVSSEVWILTILVVLLSWMTIILTSYLASKHDHLQVQSRRARPELRLRWQHNYLDIVLFLFSCVLYWQLLQSDGFIRRSLAASLSIDPLLLLAPTLLMAASAFLLLRIFPKVLSLLGKLTGYSRSFVLPISVTRLARFPQTPGRTVIIISLVAGLSIFSSVFNSTLANRQNAIAHYIAGADIVLQATPEQAKLVLRESGIVSASSVYRSSVQSYTIGSIDLLAVDSETFAQVARYPEGITTLTIKSMLPALTQTQNDNVTESVAIPAIFSYSALNANQALRTTTTLSLSGTELNLEIIGRIQNFPTLSGAYIIVDRNTLFSQVNINRLPFIGEHELWISADPNSIVGLEKSLDQEYIMIDSTLQRLNLIQADTLLQSATSAFQINAISLSALSFIVYVMVNFFSLRQRTYELGILRAVGMSLLQLLFLLLTEAIIVVFCSLIMGLGIGFGLTRTMIPQLSPVLSQALSGLPISSIIVDWRVLAQLLAILCIGYLITELGIIWFYWRDDINNVLRTGDE